MNTIKKGIIGVDLGATMTSAGIVHGNKITKYLNKRTPAGETKENVLNHIYSIIESFDLKDVEAIGIGVPSVVDIENGIVYDVQYIPSWKKIKLKNILEKKFNLSVYVNNDANCFAAGEKHFGVGQNAEFLVGLVIGTGLGGGIILDGRLYNGPNCGAGEFGMLPYRAKNIEYYCSGQFFLNAGKRGEEFSALARDGDPKALMVFKDFGLHMGNAIKVVLYTYDPDLIVLGGSISKDYDLFCESMWESIYTFAYRSVIKTLNIKPSETEHSAVLGAAALYLDHLKKHSKTSHYQKL
jgi:glucokinase|tara:strand:- start:2242 stop:3129 length:888 start_codon:yes stop_codon:yes gene_type:complete